MYCPNESLALKGRRLPNLHMVHPAGGTYTAVPAAFATFLSRHPDPDPDPDADADADRGGWVGTAAPPVAPVGVTRAVLGDAAAKLDGPLREGPAAFQTQVGCHLHHGRG